MRMTRIAARRSGIPGELISERECGVRWDATTHSMTLQVLRVADIDQKEAQYDYEILLNLADILQIVRTLATDAVAQSPDSIRSALGANAELLIRLLAASSGFQVQPLPSTSGETK